MCGTNTTHLQVDSTPAEGECLTQTLFTKKLQLQQLLQAVAA